MALDSAAAKTWCITVVSAVLIFVADKEKADYTYVALVPTALFFVLDGYYLSLERRFIKAYDDFVSKVHQDTVAIQDLYVVKPAGDPVEALWSAFTSFSIWPFYLTLTVMIYLTRQFIL